MATKEMTGLVALGHMLLEDGRITAIRNEDLGITLEYDDVLQGKEWPGDMKAAGWELGWRCFRCLGDGVVTVPCPCVGRPRHVQAENPCCGGWDEVECSECVGGIRWESEY